MTTITVQMLGGFEICAEGKPILTSLAGSRKALAVLQFLLLQRGREVSHKDLIAILWHKDSGSNPEIALRAVLHRIRRAAAAEEGCGLNNCIVTGQGTYRWNPEVPCTVDVEELLRSAALARGERDPAARDALNARVVTLYRGRLLPGQGGEAWAEERGVQLHAVYRAALLQHLEYLKTQDRQVELERLCRAALGLDAYDERLFLELIMALEKLGRREEAHEVARTGSMLGCLPRDMTPYLAEDASSHAVRLDEDTRSELAQIGADLNSSRGFGARICGYDTLREVYAIQREIQERLGLPLFLALVTLSRVDESKGVEEAAVAELGEMIRMQLRQSDVAARHGGNGYLVMLCGGAGGMNGLPAPLERVKAAFYRSPRGNDYQLGYCLNTVEPRGSHNGWDAGAAVRKLVEGEG